VLKISMGAARDGEARATVNRTVDSQGRTTPDERMIPPGSPVGLNEGDVTTAI
jgi:hypothetical protein